MSVEDAIPSDDEIRFLPNTPVVYMAIMRTKEGAPVGIPIWSSFENKSEEKSMQNESMASTFLSLSKSISEMAGDPEEDGKIIRLNVNRKTYNIYIPHPNDNLQICFVIVFEETENVLVRDEYKVELVKVVTDTLREVHGILEFLEDDTQIRLTKEDKLYNVIFESILANIKKWDRKRVQYLKKKKEEEERAKQMELEIAENKLAKEEEIDGTED